MKPASFFSLNQRLILSFDFEHDNMLLTCLFSLLTCFLSRSIFLFDSDQRRHHARPALMLKRLKNIFSTSASDDALNTRTSNQSFGKKKLLYKERSPLTEWKLIKELGDGAFGKVYQAFHEQNKEYAAAKVINDCTDDELPDHTVEINILSECEHKNIIGFYDAYYHDKRLYIFLEYCTYGAVDHIMTTLEHGLDEKQIRFIGFEVLEALNYLHTQQFVIHRDVKASNILLTQTGQVKLADFGVSAKNSSPDQKRNEYIGTVYWYAEDSLVLLPANICSLVGWLPCGEAELQVSCSWHDSIIGRERDVINQIIQVREEEEERVPISQNISKWDSTDVKGKNSSFEFLSIRERERERERRWIFSEAHQRWSREFLLIIFMISCTEDFLLVDPGSMLVFFRIGWHQKCSSVKPVPKTTMTFGWISGHSELPWSRWPRWIHLTMKCELNVLVRKFVKRCRRAWKTVADGVRISRTCYPLVWNGIQWIV